MNSIIAKFLLRYGVLGAVVTTRNNFSFFDLPLAPLSFLFLNFYTYFYFIFFKKNYIYTVTWIGSFSILSFLFGLFLHPLSFITSYFVRFCSPPTRPSMRPILVTLASFAWLDQAFSTLLGTLDLSNDDDLTSFVSVWMILVFFFFPSPLSIAY